MISLFFQLFLSLLSTAGHSQFTVVTVAGGDVKTSFPQLSSDGRLTSGPGLSLSSRDWYAIRKVGASPSATTRNPRVFLENGDVLVVKSIESDGTKLSVQVILSDVNHFAELSIPMSAVKRIQWANPREKRAIPIAQKRKDALILLNGDSVSGNIHSIMSDRIRIQVENEERLIELSQIQEIRFNEDLLRPRKSNSRYLVLSLESGTRISLLSATSDQNELLAQTLFKNRIKIPVANIVALEVLQGIATSLADLKPNRYEYRSYDGEKHSWKANLSLTGQPLQLKGKGVLSTYERGLGLHSGARLTYSLSGKYRRLEMLAGLDPMAGRLGEAIVRIQINGKPIELPGGGVVKPDHILPIRVDLNEAKELTIEIDPGEGGFVQDHVNLVQTLLIAR